MKSYYYLLGVFNLVQAVLLLFKRDLFLLLWNSPWDRALVASPSSPLSQAMSWWGAAAATVGCASIALASASVSVQRQGFLVSLLAFGANFVAAQRTMGETILPLVAVGGFLLVGFYFYLTGRTPRK